MLLHAYLEMRAGSTSLRCFGAYTSDQPLRKLVFSVLGTRALPCCVTLTAQDTNLSSKKSTRTRLDSSALCLNSVFLVTRSNSQHDK